MLNILYYPVDKDLRDLRILAPAIMTNVKNVIEILGFLNTIFIEKFVNYGKKITMI